LLKAILQAFTTHPSLPLRMLGSPARSRPRTKPN
jgi:hypothetical protein